MRHRRHYLLCEEPVVRLVDNVGANANDVPQDVIFFSCSVHPWHVDFFHLIEGSRIEESIIGRNQMLPGTNPIKILLRVLFPFTLVGCLKESILIGSLTLIRSPFSSQ